MKPGDRHADLMRQGFMKPARHPAKARAIVACAACLNWHPKGKHTADAAARKRNQP